jgi:hypothetical protein
MSLESEKVPELLQRVAMVSAILGPSWKFWLDIHEWEDAAHVSWYPESSPRDFPIAVDFHTMAGEGPCVVQTWDLRADRDISPEIKEKIHAVLDYCSLNMIPYGYEQS